MTDIERFQKWVQGRKDGGVHATPAECFNAGHASGVREEQELMAIRLACACDVIEQEYGGDSKVWEDVHAAFCEPSPLRDNAQKKEVDPICEHCSSAQSELTSNVRHPPDECPRRDQQAVRNEAVPALVEPYPK